MNALRYPSFLRQFLLSLVVFGLLLSPAQAYSLNTDATPHCHAAANTEHAVNTLKCCEQHATSDLATCHDDGSGCQQCSQCSHCSVSTLPSLFILPDTFFADMLAFAHIPAIPINRAESLYRPPII